MNTEPDVTPLVRSWLRAEPDVSAKPILDDVLAMLDTNTQGPSRPQLSRVVDPRSPTALLLAAAAVVVVALVGITLRPWSSIGTGSPSPTAPSATPYETSSPPQTPEPPILDPEIPSGPYVISNPQVRAIVTMPAGWRRGGEAAVYQFEPTESYLASLNLGLETTEIGTVVSDVCAPEESVELAPVGPSVADLVGSLSAQVGGERTGPTEVIVGGHPASRFVIRITPDCPGAGWRPIWTDGIGTYGFAVAGQFTGIIDVVDVDGRRVVLTRTYGPQASAERIAESEAIVASVRFEPIAGAGQLPRASESGGLARGRHELTVDGVRFSFETPAYLRDRGWGRYRSIYISKDVHGGQQAEAVVYWTGVPDGADVSLCRELPVVPEEASAADLAAILAAAPGTSLVTGPTEASVGGRPAIRLTLTIRELLGCDPGYLFTWEAASGGPMWMSTGPTDTVRVWIVDVEDRLFVMVTITDTWATVALADEIQAIVDSIRFE